jgi:hypothetical protein
LMDLAAHLVATQALSEVESLHEGNSDNVSSFKGEPKRVVGGPADANVSLSILSDVVSDCNKKAYPDGVAPGSHAAQLHDLFLPVSPVKYYACWAGQSCAIGLLFCVLAWGIFIPWRLFTYCNDLQLPVVLTATYMFLVLSAMFPALMILAIIAKWSLIGRFRAGIYPLWGWFYFRWWFVSHLIGTPRRRKKNILSSASWDIFMSVTD